MYKKYDASECLSLAQLMNSMDSAQKHLVNVAKVLEKEILAPALIIVGPENHVVIEMSLSISEFATNSGMLCGLLHTTAENFNEFISHLPKNQFRLMVQHADYIDTTIDSVIYDNGLIIGKNNVEEVSNAILDLGANPFKTHQHVTDTDRKITTGGDVTSETPSDGVSQESMSTFGVLPDVQLLDPIYVASNAINEHKGIVDMEKKVAENKPVPLDIVGCTCLIEDMDPISASERVSLYLTPTERYKTYDWNNRYKLAYGGEIFYTGKDIKTLLEEAYVEVFHGNPRVWRSMDETFIKNVLSSIIRIYDSFYPLDEDDGPKTNSISRNLVSLTMRAKMSKRPFIKVQDYYSREIARDVDISIQRNRVDPEVNSAMFYKTTIKVAIGTEAVITKEFHHHLDQTPYNGDMSKVYLIDDMISAVINVYKLTSKR